MQTAQPRIITDLPASQPDCEADGASEFLLDEALARVEQGWSPKQSILNRAACIRRANDAPLMEILARQIEALQWAITCRGANPAWLATLKTPPVWAGIVWQIKPQPWAVRLNGAHMLDRTFSTPAGVTHPAEAVRYSSPSVSLPAITADDIEIRQVLNRAAA